jgi:site-specific DNA-cytosine methylase
MFNKVQKMNRNTNVDVSTTATLAQNCLLGAGFRVLVACEESDEVRGRFEALGFDAWSCDLQPNRNPKAKHYQGDIFDIINDGWDAMIAFPPCTHLAVSGARHFEQKRKDGRQQQGIDFFMAMVNAPIKRIAVENPMGIMRFSGLAKLPNRKALKIEVQMFKIKNVWVLANVDRRTERQFCQYRVRCSAFCGV